MTRTREESAADLSHEEARKDAMRRLYVAVHGTPTEPDDKDVPGVYLALVDPELTLEQQAEVALDALHYNVAIGCLDDFDIVVLSAEGALLPRMENYDEGSLRDRGEFGGYLAPDDVPASVRATMDARQQEADTGPSI